MKKTFSKLMNHLKPKKAPALSENHEDGDWGEFEGRSKEDAIERACTALNTTRAYLEYKTIGGGKIKARKTDVKQANVREGQDDGESLGNIGNQRKPERAPREEPNFNRQQPGEMKRHPRQHRTPRNARPEGQQSRAPRFGREQREYEIYDNMMPTGGDNDHSEPQDRDDRPSRGFRGGRGRGGQGGGQGRGRGGFDRGGRGQGQGRGQGAPRGEQGGRGDVDGNRGNPNPQGNRGPRPEREPRAARPERPRREGALEGARESTREAAPVEPDTRDYAQLAQEGETLLRDILKFIDVPAEVVTENTEEELVFDLQADGSGLLIGKRGQMLEALQHLVAKILKLDRNSSKRLIVDSEGYRTRRSDSLSELAANMAEKARRSRKSVSLEPMNAMDRRAIHMALAGDRSISTRSVGEGYDRRIVISPRREDGERGDRGGDRGGEQGGNREGGGRSRGRRGGRGRGRGRGDADGNRGGRGQGGERAQPKANRMHDSYDVPAEPKMDLFPDNIDDLVNADFGEE